MQLSFHQQFAAIVVDIIANIWRGKKSEVGEDNMRGDLPPVMYNIYGVLEAPNIKRGLD
jgi:hypothetical protein